MFLHEEEGCQVRVVSAVEEQQWILESHHSNPISAEPTGTTKPQCTSSSHTECIYNVLVKVLSPKYKKDYHQHILRDISPRMITTPEALKVEVSVQLGEIVYRLLEFPKNPPQKKNQNQKDLQDTWQLFVQNTSLIFLAMWKLRNSGNSEIDRPADCYSVDEDNNVKV